MQNNLNQIYITRFVAALMVVIYHFGLTVAPFDSGKVNLIFSFGNEAVNYFFFLSGFIMAIAYYKSEFSNGIISKYQYWVNRFARIYPVYLLALILVALFYILIDQDIFTSFFLRFPIEVVLLQSWVGKTSLNFPGWSLSVELFFYISFPYLLFQLAKKNSRQLLVLFFFVYLIGQALYVLTKLQFGDSVRRGLAIDYFPGFNFSTFVIGSITGMLFIRHREWLVERSKLVKFVGYTASAVLFFGIIYCWWFKEFHHDGLLSPVYAFFIIAFSPQTKFTKWLGNSFFIFLGEISYSVYILQYPIWLFYRKMFGIQMGWPGFHFWGYLLSLILVSSFVFKIYELRMQSAVKNWLSKKV